MLKYITKPYKNIRIKRVLEVLKKDHFTTMEKEPNNNLFVFSRSIGLQYLKFFNTGEEDFCVCPDFKMFALVRPAGYNFVVCKKLK